MSIHCDKQNKSMCFFRRFLLSCETVHERQEIGCSKISRSYISAIGVLISWLARSSSPRLVLWSVVFPRHFCLEEFSRCSPSAKSNESSLPAQTNDQTSNFRSNVYIIRILWVYRSIDELACRCLDLYCMILVGHFYNGPHMYNL